MFQTVLLEGQQIKIPFGDDHTILLRGITLGHREAVENFSFMIDTRLWRIKILGLSFSNHPSTEPDDPLMEVKNRKEDPSSKSIIPTFLLFRKDQTQFPCQFEGDLLPLEMLDQAIPTVGRISQPVFRNDFRVDPSLRDVLSTFLALSTLGEKVMKIV
jgi:hypothetical protein